MKQEMEQLYEESGQVVNITQLLVGIAIGLGVFVIINIFMGTLGGRTYQLVESDINSITNTTIKGYINDGIAGSFQGTKTLGEYTPLIVLSIVIFLVLVLVTQFTGAAGGGAGGSVL